MSGIHKSIPFLLLLGIALTDVAYGQSDILVQLNDFYPEEIKQAGFKLSSATVVALDLSVLQPRKSSNDLFLTYAWILNSDTRNKVWEVFDANPQDREGENLVFQEEVELSPGTYEAYYSTYPYYDRWGDDHFHFDGLISGILRVIFDRKYDNRYVIGEYEDLYFNISGTGTRLNSEEISTYQQQLKDKAIISLTAQRDDAYVTEQIRVKQPVSVRIYALGEARKNEPFDFGWITDIRSRERIWQFDYRRSEHAGGALKNRLIDTEIELQPGDYEVVYLTDDSHSYRDWNMAAPYDPEFWGLTIWPVDPQGKNLVMKVEDVERDIWKNVVRFEKARDNDYFAEGFTLGKPMPIHILALGEGQDGDMYDYAWIVQSNTRRKVWRMDFYETECAGGAEKNRVFDGVVNLEKGNYMVYYVTDGSHAYRSWNSGKPYNPKSWGVSVSAPVGMVDEGYVKSYVEEEDPSVLARITRVGDHARKKEKFAIDRDQYIHIYALGEGDDGEMYDYAWIEDANTGKVIWEMTYRKTDRAGGARKNRMFDDRILLPAGEYYVIYESDDSHSFSDWNASPPFDQLNYGVTISYVDN